MEADKRKPQQKPKHERPEPKREHYDFNADLITEETEIPPLPKKAELLHKPDIEVFRTKEKALLADIKKIKEKKAEIRAQNFKPQRRMVKGDSKSDEFHNKIEEVSELREQFNEARLTRNGLRDELKALFAEHKSLVAEVKELRGKKERSRESMGKDLGQLERRLISEELTKEEEKHLNMQIMELKRNMVGAVNEEDIEIRLLRNEDRLDEVSEEIEGLKAKKEEFEVKTKEYETALDAKNEVIKGIKGEISAKNSEYDKVKEQNQSEWELWKEQKKEQLNKLEEKIVAAGKSIDAIWDDYFAKKEAYWKQKRYVEYLEWQMRTKNKKLADKQRIERDRIWAEKEVERQKAEQLSRYIREIELCATLTAYLEELTAPKGGSAAQPKPVEEKDISLANFGKDVQVLPSKKSKADEEYQKKPKKHKKKKEEDPKEHFEVSFGLQADFGKIHLLPPESLEDVPRVLKELKEREELYRRCCVEEISPEDKQAIEALNPKVAKASKRKQPPKMEEDFPVLAETPQEPALAEPVP